MGTGERAVISRQRIAGVICSKCHSIIDPPPTELGERVCDTCLTSGHVMSICQVCGAEIPPEPMTGHDVHSDPILRRKLCWKCYINRPRHRILMQFFVREAWHISFTEADCETHLRRTIDAKDASTILELAKRGDADLDEDDGFALNKMIKEGRGTVWLYLLEEQYRKLK